MDTLFIPLMEQLLHQTGLLDITPGNIVMIITGMVLLYLGIVKKYEPFLLVGIGFSCIVANIPGSTLTKEGGLFWYSYQGVENLIDFCKNNGRRLIQISTVSVAGEGSDGVPPMSRVFCENDLYIGQNITNEYIRTKFLAERAVLEAVSEGLDGKVVRVGNLMSRNSDGEFQINFITNGFLRSLRGYAAVGKFPMGGMHEVAEFSPIDSTALAVLRLAQTDRRFTVFHACNSHHIYMADLIYAMRSYGFRIDIVRDEEFEAAVKEFAKTGQDSDAVSGLIAYTSHNENEIYTIDYSNRFTAQVLYRLDYKWPVTDDRYLENAIAALDRLTFFD